jgi:hypothetical protein
LGSIVRTLGVRGTPNQCRHRADVVTHTGRTNYRHQGTLKLRLGASGLASLFSAQVFLCPWPSGQHLLRLSPTVPPHHQNVPGHRNGKSQVTTGPSHMTALAGQGQPYQATGTEWGGGTAGHPGALPERDKAPPSAVPVGPWEPRSGSVRSLGRIGLPLPVPKTPS